MCRAHPAPPANPGRLRKMHASSTAGSPSARRRRRRARRGEEPLRRALVVELHLVRRQAARSVDDVGHVVLVDEVGAELQHPCSSSGARRRGCPGSPPRRCSGSWSAGTWRRTPTSAARRVLEADPLVQILGSVVGRHRHGAIVRHQRPIGAPGRLTAPMATPPAPPTSSASRSSTSSSRAATRRGAVGEPDPARPDRAVQRRRDGAVQAVLRRRRGAAVQAGGQLAEVRPRRWQAQRPRRRRAHQAPPRVLRDARQLQLRRLLQGAEPSRGAGSSSPRCWGFDGDRIWVTVHESDDEAEAIWHEQVGVPMERIQRLGDKDNFWQMGDTGPCGPCSELHIDRGPAFGPDGGPLGDPQGDRFMEFWNLVFMQYDQAPDGSARRRCRSRRSTPVPASSASSASCRASTRVWETDLMRPLIDQAVRAHRRSRTRAGDYDDRDSFAMRVLAEHARSAAMLVDDGVFPSQRGPGLRAAADHPPRRALRLPARHRAAGDAAARRRRPST